MKLGIDLSIMDELNELHPVYRYKDKEIEPFHFFSEHNHISMVRLRLWINPYDDKGNPYGGGTNDLPCFIHLAKKANKEGMKVMLDFHYSDFWVDPSRQKLSKDWLKYKTIDEIENVLYEYTKETLLAAKKEEIDIGAIQIGNEITNGMVHPFGEISKEYNEVTGGGFKGFARLYKGKGPIIR